MHPASALLLVLIHTSLGLTQERQEFRVTIEREVETDACTRGRVLVNGEYLCKSIELRWRENQKNVSSIPAGSYKGQLRYDKADQWRIQLADVPGRSGVQIHIGNYTSEIRGCVLVGAELGADGCSIAAGTSKLAYTALRKKFYGTDTPNSCPDLAIIVEVVAPPSALGTWKSQANGADPDGRFTLVVEKGRVKWTERNKSGAELTREIKTDTAGARFVLERQNDDEVLRFLDFADAHRRELLTKNLLTSKLTIVVAKGELNCQWTGLLVTTTKSGGLDKISYPAKQLIFRRQ